MGQLYLPNSRDEALVIDASVVINLIASGYAGKIMESLDAEIVAVAAVSEELARGKSNGRKDADRLEEIIKDGYIRIVALDSEGEKIFETLTVGPASSTLDDGEAATIAYALGVGGIAVIDERKAARICSERFPTLKTASSLELFSACDGSGGLSRVELRDAVTNALQVARMRVFHDQCEWVVKLIGKEMSRKCPSLPRRCRG